MVTKGQAPNSGGKRRVDVLAILATQGIGLLAGFFIYGSFLGDTMAYYWMIPTGLVGVVSGALAFRTHRQMRVH